MPIIFPADPLDTESVDPAYTREAQAVASLGMDTHVLDFESLLHGDTRRALNRIPAYDTPIDALYRGWMLKPAQYTALYDALHAHGLHLINTPAMYRHCHHLPENYPVIAMHTPFSVWLPYDDAFSMDAVHAALQVFGDKPIIVKDYVKSQKHYWHEACYIPRASDREAVERVVFRFLELQGDDLNMGLVFRVFVEFAALTEHTTSGMPLTQEFRVFVADCEMIYTMPYWSQGDYTNINPQAKRFTAIATRVNSRFYTMDIARRRDGKWMIVELGDGQVAGLPDHADAMAFYGAIGSRLGLI